jgi:hypothetical protein
MSIPFFFCRRTMLVNASSIFVAIAYVVGKLLIFLLHCRVGLLHWPYIQNKHHHRLVIRFSGYDYHG